ncbi:hypothetical protein C7378_1947 [Acidipila rosea]|uniref:Uncharacterized protein n=1 Tax=Acidipila rosea TaxID=768535 RepID=A0A4R1L7W3_9BACT|nr:hypothetical protein C7378_1947 [Acidipila rosea]
MAVVMARTRAALHSHSYRLGCRLPAGAKSQNEGTGEQKRGSGLLNRQRRLHTG